MMPYLSEVPLRLDVLILASELRERRGSLFPDSLHAATALSEDEHIISADRDYGRLMEEGLIWIRPEDII